MGQEEVVRKLLSENSKAVSDEASRLLLKISDNILKDPSNTKLRLLQKSNTTISSKVLAAKGATECLKFMGFQELYSHPFLRNIERYFHDVLQYEDKNLQQRAREIVPLAICEERAQRRLRGIQELVKKKKLEDLEISIQETLILELLEWFKEEFFSWVDSPTCSKCGGETTFSHMSTDPSILVYTNRVENIIRNDNFDVRRYIDAKRVTNSPRSPRYTDLNILLETRRGRCGEWANTFTLFCRAMGWDARFVVDEGDHVWTEVYSVTQKRWLHCDACENACDTPLLYETGWNKKISYVIAYSCDEVQDVTWRYSSNHGAVLKRRNNISESELLDALFKLRTRRQQNFSEAKRRYLTKRMLSELVEFLTEKKPLGFGGYAGEEAVNNEVTLRYSATLDKYEFISGGERVVELKGWSEGTAEHSDMFRKEEKDWKMVYLTRREGSSSGKISWKVELVECIKHIDAVSLNFDYATFENGVIKTEVSFDNCSMLVPNGETKFSVKDVCSSSVTITASLSGGKGDVAWQHAQLFRQSTDSNEFPFCLTVTLK
ncbi:hypothetical protein NQ318_013273 [Aromia moschata]|uniref:Peptide-N(4)-(N-acetyl-beta-glucosaminyl)asparagine amidase n=1 Tax=Aromia moschata TaxID=1265417 RepID=A0AAV8XS69_9CUCU|nr:hypothetical protein NQ318_013273 [Aromia moschata]